MNALKKPPPPDMTVAEFLSWAESVDGLWQLRDGAPEMMAPPSGRHGVIEGRLLTAINIHFDKIGSRCVCAANPGVVPRGRSDRNMLVPGIGVTSTPMHIGAAFPDPVALIEVLSPSNEAETRANVVAFKTIDSVAEIVVVDSRAVAAEIFRRRSDGTWPEQPERIGGDGRLALNSIGLDMPLRDAYRRTDLGGSR